MAYRDDGFGSGFGAGVGSRADGPFTSRGVLREPSRVHRSHEDERPLHPAQQHANYPGYHQGYADFTRGQPVPVRHGGYVDHQHEHPGWRDPHAYEHAHGTDMGLGEPDRGPHYGKGPKGYRRSDERIREEACERIARQGLIDASDVEVHVENAVIRLTGTVATRPEKRGLEQILERVHGVEEITNELRLRRDAAPAAVQAQAAPPRPRDNGRSSHS